MHLRLVSFHRSRVQVGDQLPMLLGDAPELLVLGQLQMQVYSKLNSTCNSDGTSGNHKLSSAVQDGSIDERDVDVEKNLDGRP